jgi:hypothetical protein
MIKAWTRVVGSIAVGALSLGCVGYDGGSDAASAEAAALGVTAEEELAIREALAKPALTEEELAIETKLAAGQAITVEQFEAMKAELEKWEKLPEEQRTNAVSYYGMLRGARDGAFCAGDINCASKHCGQAGICLPLNNFIPDVTATVGGYRDWANSPAARCSANHECQSNRCEGDVCRAPRLTDANGIKDGTETDVDCGGERTADGGGSPYACPLGGTCAFDDDCVAGYCLSVVDTSVSPSRIRGKKCSMLGANLTDVGRLWPAPLSSPTADPYPAAVRIPVEGSDEQQRMRVRAAPLLYASTPNASEPQLVPAEQSPGYQHDVCAAHLVANGCSPAVFQARAHREAYEYFICPRSSRAKIGISRFEVPRGGDVDFGNVRDRGSKTLELDPYLCNHPATHGVRVWTKSKTAGPRAVWGMMVGQLQVDGWFPNVYFDGYLLQSISSQPITRKLTALGWLDELQKFLLLGAACNRGRVTIGPTRLGATGPTMGGAAGVTRIKEVCETLNAWNTRTEVSSANLTTTEVWALWGWIAQRVLFPAELKQFIKDNVPYWEEYDVYSIDPEGNPYKPVNKNMQWGWDAMHPGTTFAAYAKPYADAYAATGQRVSVVLMPDSYNYSFGGKDGYPVYGLQVDRGAATPFNFAR